MSDESKKSEKIGLTRRQAKEEMDRLQREGVRIVGMMNTTTELHRKPQHEEALRRLGERMAQAREWYVVGVLESLEKESRTLKWLTLVLMALTGVLIVFTGLLAAGIKLP